MYSTRELILKISQEGDHDKMVILGDLMEELIESSNSKEEYKYHLHQLLHGPHFDDCTLKESGVKIKYGIPEITRFMQAQGITFDECVTIEDITYTANYLYFTFYPLISDINQALKFTEKYIKDVNYPVKNGKPFLEWFEREKLKKNHQV
jgi:hypothetical protein